jgi:ketosteroid isomerase-like protein
MSHVLRPISRTLRLLALSAALCGPAAALADEYGDVSQLLRTGKSSEALAKADQFLAGKPRDPQMRFLKGVILSETGRGAEAITVFTKLTEDYPELPEPYNNLAVLHAGQSQFDKARAALEMAIRTNPSYATAHENLGDVYAKLASQAYSKALQLDAGNTAVQPKLALIRELFAAPDSRPRAAGASVAAARPSAAAPAPAIAAARPPTAPVAATPAPAPAVVAKAPAPAPAAAAAAQPAVGNSALDVEAAVRAWAAAWAAKDVPGYLAAYGREFNPPGKQTRKAWEDERRARILGKSRITVKLSDLSVNLSGNKATAVFRQAYTADTLNVSSRKTLELTKAGDRWLIVREASGA